MFVPGPRRCDPTPNQVIIGNEPRTTEPPMPDKARHVRRYLRGTDAVAALLNELQRRDELLQRIRGAVPEALRSHCKQVSLRDGVLKVLVDSPVWVSRLRFLSPQLVDDLRKLDLVVDDCRVRALPEEALVPAESREAATFSPPAAANHLTQAADVIADPELASSLRRLANSLSKRAAAV
jgi:hypothetical protein